jgi:hypothetical protein
MVLNEVLEGNVKSKCIYYIPLKSTKKISQMRKESIIKYYKVLNSINIDREEQKRIYHL